MAGAWAGLRPGDEVVAIDGAPTRDLSAEQIDRKLVGRIGSKVILLVVRDGVTRPIEVERGPFAPRGGEESW
jgi:carboxyl-terminal processing protease